MLERIKEPWPADYKEILLERQRFYLQIEKENGAETCMKHYSTRPLSFISDWGVVVEPRKSSSEALALLPFAPFKRQVELIQFLYRLLKDRESGLVEKSRDMGATWTGVLFSIWLYLFWPGAVVGWGSRGSDEVDQIGNPDSILEKCRIALRNVPPFLLPKGFSFKEHMPFMRIINPETNAMIRGDVGDNIGRGGRSLIYFKDESAHYVHPEMVEASLSENAAIQVDISSVYGTGTVFHRKREAGVEWTPGADMPKGQTRVFVMDWRSHPGKDQDWYDTKRKQKEAEGLLHIFAQEVDRDYSAAVEGVIIPTQWVKAAIDAHIRLGIGDDGLYGAGLDIADEGSDTNAITVRKGIVCKEVGEWGARDIGVTTRNVINAVRDVVPLELQYDSVGMGSTVKAEYNRLKDEDLIPKGLRLVPWNAGASPLWKDRRLDPRDNKSPLNGDYFHNLKAQAWWNVSRRFLNTWRIFNDPSYAAGGIRQDELISLDSKSIGHMLYKLVKELSQPTIGQSSKLKLVIDKKPDGAKSPNMADSFVMCYWPAVEHKKLKITGKTLERARMPNVMSLNRALSRRR